MQLLTMHERARPAPLPGGAAIGITPRGAATSRARLRIQSGSPAATARRHMPEGSVVVEIIRARAKPMQADFRDSWPLEKAHRAMPDVSFCGAGAGAAEACPDGDSVLCGGDRQNRW